MNIMQAAKHLGVSDKTIRRAIHAGNLRARYPQHNRAEIDESDLEQWYTTTTIRATPDETQARLAALERHVQALSSEVQLLREQMTSLPSTT
jgi:excisionase family DNA binding protein